MSPRPPATLRDRGGQDLREHLIATAARLLGERGSAGLSVRDIAREAHVADGVLYNYFADKDDLLAHALLVHVGGVMTAIPAMPAPGTGSVAANLERFIETGIEALTRVTPAFAGLLAQPGVLVRFHDMVGGEQAFTGPPANEPPRRARTPASTRARCPRSSPATCARNNGSAASIPPPTSTPPPCCSSAPSTGRYCRGCSSARRAAPSAARPLRPVSPPGSRRRSWTASRRQAPPQGDGASLPRTREPRKPPAATRRRQRDLPQARRLRVRLFSAAGHLVRRGRRRARRMTTAANRHRLNPQAASPRSRRMQTSHPCSVPTGEIRARHRCGVT